MSRREVVRFGAALIPSLAAPRAALAADPKYVRISFATPGAGATGVLGDVTVELTRGANAPAVATFAALCAGTLSSPCDRDSTRDAILERVRLEKGKALQSCLAGEGQPLSYEGSTVWRVLPGSRVDAGALASTFNLRLPPFIEGDNDGGRLTHDSAGIVSMRRGTDGAGTFLITAAPQPALDADYVIVGRVVRGIDVVQALAALPTIKSGNGVGYQALAGDISGRARPAKGCRYGSAELYCTDGKPLRKVAIRARLLDALAE